MRRISTHCLQMIFFLSVSYGAGAADLGQQKAQLEAGINALGRNVAVLEQSTLLPSSTTTAVFLSLPPALQYTPQSITVRIDGKEQATHEYTPQEIAALRAGALHTVWQGKVSAGNHQLDVSLAGLDRKNKPVQHAVQGDFTKAAGYHSLELQMTLAEKGSDTIFSVKDWGDKE